VRDARIRQEYRTNPTGCRAMLRHSRNRTNPTGFLRTELRAEGPRRAGR